MLFRNMTAMNDADHKITTLHVSWSIILKEEITRLKFGAKEGE
jgi:hypothetical protein